MNRVENMTASDKTAVDPLARQLQFYRKNREEFAQTHHNEFVLIHSEKVVGYYNSDLDAYAAAKERFAPGTFAICPCIFPSEEKTRIFRTRVS